MMGRVLGVVVLALVLHGCASAVGSGYGQGGVSSDGRSYSEARADNAITAQVNTLLVQDRQIPAMDIEVTTRNRVVTLSGTVPSRELAYRAGQLAASVAGVYQVINHLRVAP